MTHLHLNAARLDFEKKNIFGYVKYELWTKYLALKYIVTEK